MRIKRKNILLKILRLIRFILTSSFFLLFILLFIKLINFNIIVKIQFIPSIFYSISYTKIFIFFSLFILILTSIFGRIYCSFLCPLGLFQEIIIIKKKFSYKNLNFFFLILIPLIVFLLITLFKPFKGFFDPYSLFGKFLVIFVIPFINFINNIFHLVISSILYIRNFFITSYLFFFIFFLFLALIIFSKIYGKVFCNFFCPIGKLLGFFSKISIFKIYIDNNKCTKCLKCEKNCPALCIDTKSFYVDYSRCFLCLKCFICPSDAINYGIFSNKKQLQSYFLNISKNLFFSLILLGIFSKFNSFQIIKEDKHTNNDNKKRILPSPPGSISLNHLKNFCTSCLLCVSHCPTKVLKPSFNEYSFEGLFMPVMNYPQSFCIYECNKCSEICPTGAIRKISLEDKKKIQIGKSFLIKEECIVYKNKLDCGACSEVCPTKAVYMIKYDDTLYAPVIEQDFCVGCGACENVCPAIPKKAIYVKGLKEHSIAKIREKDNYKDIDNKNFENENKMNNEDFPF